MPLIYDENNIKDTEEYMFELYGEAAPDEDYIRNRLIMGYCTWDVASFHERGICYYYLPSEEKENLVIGYCFVTPTFKYMTEPKIVDPDVYLGRELLNEVEEIGH